MRVLVFLIVAVACLGEISNHPHSKHPRLFANFGWEHHKQLLQRATQLLQKHECKHIYIDLGTNIGIQIRKLYEPHLYPKSPVGPIFDTYFGNASERQSVCSFGFEANPTWDTRLSQLDASYNAAKYPVVMFTSTAAGIDTGNITFYMEINKNPKFHQWGSSLVNWANFRNDSLTTVGSLDIAAFLNNIIMLRPHQDENSAIVMKIDVEGFEYPLLSHLLLHGALCKVDFIYVEYHDVGIDKKPENPSTREFEKVMKYVERHAKHCKLNMSTIDDERYGIGDDPHPLPAPVRVRDLTAIDRRSITNSNSNNLRTG